MPKLSPEAQRRLTESVFLTRPPDPAAIDVGSVAALQPAVDRYVERRTYGIVFLVEGTYRLTETLLLWRGVRIIGIGKERPRLLLPAQTQGFGDPANPRPLMRFCDEPDENGEPRHGDNTTFFSALWNVDIVIETGNPGAVAVDFPVAQLSFLRSVRIDASDGFAAIDRAGNELESVHLHGGRYGIRTPRTPAGWPLTIRDCLFEGQDEAAIASAEAGLTILRTEIRNVPNGIVFDPELGHAERVVLEDSSITATKHAIVTPPRGTVGANLSVANSCLNGAIASIEGETWHTEGGYVKHLSRGLHARGFSRVESPGCDRMEIETTDDPPTALPDPDTPVLPAVETWHAVEPGNVDSLRAVLAQHEVVYLPTGEYVVDRTITLRPGQTLLGLHPATTIFRLEDGTDGFADAEQPNAIVQSSESGEHHLRGVGFHAGGNPGAVGLRWSATAASSLDDLHTDSRPAEAPVRVSSQASLWLEGAGGTVRNVWTATMRAQTGLRICHSSLRGRVSNVSVEHHQGADVELSDLRNWTFFALQTEANAPCEHSIGIRITCCRDLRFANLYLYRVMALANHVTAAVEVEEDASGLIFDGARAFSWGPAPFVNLVGRSEPLGWVRHRELARWTSD